MCEPVRGVVCGSWDPLVLLGPFQGPRVCFDDSGEKEAARPPAAPHSTRAHDTQHAARARNLFIITEPIAGLCVFNHKASQRRLRLSAPLVDGLRAAPDACPRHKATSVHATGFICTSCSCVCCRTAATFTFNSGVGNAYSRRAIARRDAICLWHKHPDLLGTQIFARFDSALAAKCNRKSRPVAWWLGSQPMYAACCAPAHTDYA